MLGLASQTHGGQGTGAQIIQKQPWVDDLPEARKWYTESIHYMLLSTCVDASAISKIKK